MTAGPVRAVVRKLELEIKPELIRQLIKAKTRYTQNPTTINYMRIEQQYNRIAIVIPYKHTLKSYLDTLSRA